jgi:hypothetical protein
VASLINAPVDIDASQNEGHIATRTLAESLSKRLHLERDNERNLPRDLDSMPLVV